MPLLNKRNMDGFEEDYADVLNEAENVILKCFEKHDVNEVFLSFNGGKDCTVLLDITINILKKLLKTNTVGGKLKILYIRTENPFPELEDFVKQIQRHYGLNLKEEMGDLRSTLERILAEDGRLKACLMGTRRSDPYSENLKFIQKTDANWPEILRVSPLLNWSYHQIWTYILKNNIPYCSLYDEGYTSIGSTLNTEPNPALLIKNSNKITYLPAWKLADASLERAGRGVKKTREINGLEQNGVGHKNGRECCRLNNCLRNCEIRNLV